MDHNLTFSTIAGASDCLKGFCLLFFTEFFGILNNLFLISKDLWYGSTITSFF